MLSLAPCSATIPWTYAVPPMTYRLPPELMVAFVTEPPVRTWRFPPFLTGVNVTLAPSFAYR